MKSPTSNSKDDLAEQAEDQEEKEKAFIISREPEKAVMELHEKMLEMVYRVENLEGERVITQQLQKRLDKNEKDQAMAMGSSKSNIEAFKLEVEMFQERMTEFELEAENAKRTSQFIQSNLELY